jgi:hypothetical protein
VIYPWSFPAVRHIDFRNDKPAFETVRRYIRCPGGWIAAQDVTVMPSSYTVCTMAKSIETEPAQNSILWFCWRSSRNEAYLYEPTTSCKDDVGIEGVNIAQLMHHHPGVDEALLWML